MPAIQLSRLKLQAAELAEHFDDPDTFMRKCTDLFEFYADRTHRPSRAGAPPPVIPTYKIQPPALRIILLELTPLARSYPQEALSLANIAWGNGYLEFRLLAINLVGAVPATPHEPVVERILSWNQENQEDKLLASMANQGLANLRKGNHALYLELVASWLSESNLNTQKLGVQALVTLIEEPRFENLPVAYRLLTPICQDAASELRPYLLDGIRALASISPQETAYFLRQLLSARRSKSSLWLARHSLEFLPPDIRKRIRTMLRG
jgi:hypothetical protein